LLVSGFAVLFAALAENTFAAPVFKIQKERGQKVISSGVYAVGRHPIYLGGMLLFAGAPLLLNSIYGLATGVLLAITIFFRSTGEEKLLARELEGYDEYMEKVRWRLIPFVF
jgi:protein-S-isoprenylcysteine O-methyltransferase Ste14